MKIDENEPVSVSRMTPPVLLTVEEARQTLRISRWSLNRLIQRRKLASVRIGRRRLVPVTAIETFVEQLRQEEAA